MINLLRIQYKMTTENLSRIHSMEGYLALDLLIPKKIWKVVKRLEFVKDVELLLNLRAQNLRLRKEATIQEFQNYTLVKIVISVCRESFEVKETL